jgi:hypothetical protein
MTLGKGRTAEIVHQQRIAFTRVCRLQTGEWTVGDKDRLGMKQGSREPADPPQIPARQAHSDVWKHR